MKFKYPSMFCFVLMFLMNFFQAQKFSGTFSFPIEKIELIKKDRSIYNIYYEISFAIDSNDVNNKSEDIGVLQIGKSFSKFSSYNLLKKDSLLYSFSKNKESLGAKEMSIMFQYKNAWENSLLKNLVKKNNIVQDVAVNNYQYNERQPVFEWELSDETKSVFGYQCRKATTYYKGRKYIAWYTKDIPINNGPYVFEGLPGLILQIYDSKFNYSFKAIALDSDDSEIYLKKSPNILILSRKEFKQVQQNYHDNPGFYHGKAFNADGSVMNIKSNPIPYNPIELE